VCHAAVVDHCVQPFGRMHSRAYWTNLLAGRVLAMLAGHRLEVCARRGQVALKISVDAQPLHIAADADLLLAHHGNIILRITAHDAGIAARATVHVDRHAPRIVLVLPVGEHRIVAVGLGVALALVGKTRIGLVLSQRCVANNPALADRLIAFERVIAVSLTAKELRPVVLEVALGHRNAPLAFQLPHRAHGIERRVRGANQISIEARAACDATRLPPIAQMHCDRVIGCPGATIKGAFTLRAFTVSSTMSSSSRPYLVKVAPETIAALSQLKLVIGLGSS